MHHGNTEKIAKAIADAINADIIKAEDVNIDALADYNFIGVGSGVYGGKMHKNILELMERMPNFSNKKAVVFSTSGMGKDEYNNFIKQKLQEKGFEVLGSFACKGFDTFGPFKFIGGLAKGRPNDEDLLNAKNFALEFIKYA